MGIDFLVLIIISWDATTALGNDYRRKLVIVAHATRVRQWGNFSGEVKHCGKEKYRYI